MEDSEENTCAQGEARNTAMETPYIKQLQCLKCWHKMTNATKARSCGTYVKDKYLQKLSLKTEKGAISRES